MLEELSKVPVVEMNDLLLPLDDKRVQEQIESCAQKVDAYTQEAKTHAITQDLKAHVPLWPT